MSFFGLFSKSISVGFVSHSLLYTFSFAFCDDNSKTDKTINANYPLTIADTFRSFFFSSSSSSTSSNNNNNTIIKNNNNNNNSFYYSSSENEEQAKKYDDCVLDRRDYNVWDMDWDRSSLAYLQKQVDKLNSRIRTTPNAVTTTTKNKDNTTTTVTANDHHAPNYKIQKCHKKQILLIRHGQYENEGSSSQDGTKIKKLTLLGEQQAKLTGVYLKKLLESKKVALEKEKAYLTCRMRVKILRDEVLELKEEYKLERDNGSYNNRAHSHNNNNTNNNNSDGSDADVVFSRKNDQIHQNILDGLQNKLKKTGEAFEREKKKMVSADIERRSTGGGDSFIVAPYINKIITSDLIRAKQTALGIIESVHPFLVDDANPHNHNSGASSTNSKYYNYFFPKNKNNANNYNNNNAQQKSQADNDNALFDDGDDTLNDDTELDELEDKRRQKENVILFANKYFPQFIFKMDPLLNENFPCDPIPYHGIHSLHTLQEQVDLLNNKHENSKNNNNNTTGNKLGGGKAGKVAELPHKARKKDSAAMDEAFRKYFHRYTIVEDHHHQQTNPNKTAAMTAAEQEVQVEVIVCHANVIRYFVLQALQLPPQAWLRLSLGHGSITSLVLHGDGHVAVSTIGSHSHLPPHLLTSRNLV